MSGCKYLNLALRSSSQQCVAAFNTKSVSSVNSCHYRKRQALSVSSNISTLFDQVRHQHWSTNNISQRATTVLAQCSLNSTRCLHATQANNKVVEFLLADIGEGIQEVIVKEW